MAGENLDRLKTLATDAEGIGLYHQLRSLRQWDGEAYAQLVETTKACLEEIGDQETVPRWLAAFFARKLPAIQRLMSHPDFVRMNRGSMQEEEAALFFKDKARTLDRLILWFANRTRPQGF